MPGSTAGTPGRTLRAALRSGEPAMPMLNVCSGWSVSKALRASFMCLFGRTAKHRRLQSQSIPL